MKEQMRIPRAEFPEQVGISSAVVRDFLTGLDEEGLEFHSMMLIRHAKVAVEWYQAPFSADLPHAMYSVSKTFTATAVGLAVEEGLVSLDTRLIDLFPEYAPKEPDEFLEQLRVEHLITMSSGKKNDFLADKGKGGWMAAFIRSPWVFRPGEDFMYTNENLYAAAAVVRRVTGQTVREFLTPRLFEPLGIDVPFWETDENGTEAGGWGLYLKTEDLAKLMLCYQQGGVFGGRQVLPKAWVAKAIRSHVDSGKERPVDNKAGYCYGMWRCGSLPNAYRADGMFSQFGIVLEDYDAVLVFTSGIIQEQKALDYIWRFFPRAFTQEAVAPGPQSDAYLRSFALDQPVKSRRSSLEQTLKGKTLRVRHRNGVRLKAMPFSILPIAVSYMTTDKAGDPDRFQLAFFEHEMKLRWTEGDEVNTVRCGMDGKAREDVMRLGGVDYRTCAYAYWEDDACLVVHLRPCTTVAKRILRFEFHGRRVTVTPESTPDVRVLVRGLGAAADTMIHNPLLKRLVPAVLKLLIKAVEPRLGCRLE